MFREICFLLGLIGRCCRCCTCPYQFLCTDDTKGNDEGMRTSVSIPLLSYVLACPLETQKSDRKRKTKAMAPFSLPPANGSSSTSANATFDIHSPHPLPCQPVNQNQWGPDSISNIAFGLVMVFISLFAIYQTRRQRLHESDGEFGSEWYMDVRCC